MINSVAKMYAQFGMGTVSVGCNKFKDLEQWFIKIREIKEVKRVGQLLTIDEVELNQEIILTFPTEKQMIVVMAAFTNKTYDDVLEQFNAKKNEEGNYAE
jgi:hypothetical protein